MSGKTIFIIIITIVLTIILMKNTDEIDFWLFGSTRLPKLPVLGSMIILGFIAGYLVGRPGKKRKQYSEDLPETIPGAAENKSQLSDEDKDYIN